jgi:hypothetical protein
MVLNELISSQNEVQLLLKAMLVEIQRLNSSQEKHLAASSHLLDSDD